MAKIGLTDALVEALIPIKSQEEVYDRDFHFGGSFGVRLGRGGKKAFFLIYSVDGKRRRAALGHFPVVSDAEARGRAADILREVGLGYDPKSRARLAPQRFAPFAEYFMDRHVRKHCAEKTRREYERIIQGELLPYFGARRLAEIREREIVELVEGIAVERERRVMANRVRALLSKLFAFAVESRVLERNPVEDVPAQAGASREMRILRDPEIKSLWSALAAEELLLATAFKLMLFTGQKPGAVLSMRWNVIELDEWIVSTNAHKSHRIALSPPVIQLIRELRKSTGSAGFVFATAGGHLRHLHRGVERISIRMGSVAPWIPSDIRRTVEFGMRALRIRPDVIERVLGRNTVSPRFMRSREDYDYRADMESALFAWSRKVIAIVAGEDRPVSADKVVSLFR